MWVKKQQLDLDMEQQTGSKLGKQDIKDVYCHSAYLNYMQNTSCKMLQIPNIIVTWVPGASLIFHGDRVCRNHPGSGAPPVEPWCLNGAAEGATEGISGVLASGLTQRHSHRTS